MKIKRAIEILTELLRIGNQPGYPLDDDALKLGIEALKLLKGIPTHPSRPGRSLLPGETE